MPSFGRRPSGGDDPSLDDVRRVDQFLDALGARQTPYSTDHAEAELAFLLSDWRDEIRDTPSTVPVTTRDATAALREGLSRRSRGGRTSLALVGSIAAAVLCIGGFGAAVVGSGPGDALYGLRTALFGQEEVRDDRVSLASQQLAQVQQLVDQGQWQQAQDKLVELSSTVQNVQAPPQQKQDLIQQWNALSYKVVEQDSAATLPPAGDPLPALPNSPLTLLPVPVVDTPAPTATSASATSSDAATTPVTTSTTTTTPTTTTPTTSPSAPTASSAVTSPTATTSTVTSSDSPTPTTTAQPTTAQPTTTTAQPTTSTQPTASSTSVATLPPSPAAVQSEPSTVSTAAPSTAATQSQPSRERPEPTTVATVAPTASSPR